MASSAAATESSQPRSTATPVEALTQDFGAGGVHLRVPESWDTGPETLTGIGSGTIDPSATGAVLAMGTGGKVEASAFGATISLDATQQTLAKDFDVRHTTIGGRGALVASGLQQGTGKYFSELVIDTASSGTVIIGAVSSSTDNALIDAIIATARIEN